MIKFQWFGERTAQMGHVTIGRLVVTGPGGSIRFDRTVRDKTKRWEKAKAMVEGEARAVIGSSTDIELLRESGLRYARSMGITKVRHDRPLEALEIKDIPEWAKEASQ